MRPYLSVVLAVSCMGCAGPNYIRYNQRAIEVYGVRSAGDHRAPLDRLYRLEGKYRLLPPETYAIGHSLCVLGDTLTARKYFIRSALEGDPPWMYLDRDSLLDHVDSVWYDELADKCLHLWRTHYPYIDGPNGTVHTPISRINQRHQFVIDSLSGIHGGYGPELAAHPDAQLCYDHVRKMHDAVLDSMIHGELEVPSIARYGMNSEFDTFTYHVSPEFLHAKRRTFRKWLRKGWIFPRTYANCFDRSAGEKGVPVPFGVLLGMAPSEVESDFMKNRWRIGMGSDDIDRIRFNWYSP